MDATTEFILDNSVAMVWGFDDEADPYAESLLDLMPTSRAYVPTLWPLEVSNVLLVGERRKRITPADAIRMKPNRSSTLMWFDVLAGRSW